MSVFDDLKKAREAIGISSFEDNLIHTLQGNLVYLTHLYRKLEKENERLKLKIKELEG